MHKPKKRPRDPNQLGKMIVDISVGEIEDRAPVETKNQAAATLGSLGGKARAKSMSAKKRAAIAKKAAAARWKASE